MLLEWANSSDGPCMFVYTCEKPVQLPGDAPVSCKLLTH
jgi:hypothetical protein